MIVDKYIKKVIEDYIKASYIHDNKVIKRLNKYLKFYEFILIKSCLSRYGHTQKRRKNYCFEVDKQKKFLKSGEFRIKTSKERRLFEGTISSKFIIDNNIHSHIESKDVKLFDVLKRDFIAMNILIKVRGKQPLASGYTGAIYRLNDLQIDLTIENMWDTPQKEIIFSVDHLHWRDDCFKVDNRELELLLNTNSNLCRRIRNYSLMEKLANKGNVIHKIENITGRIHHNISQISSEYRALIRTTKGVKMTNYDLKSSHLFWLAILTKNEKLYESVVTGELKGKFDKKRLLTWLNSKNYNSSTYLKINNFMEDNYIEHERFRNENKVLYYTLGKLEADYVLGISNELKASGVENYTVHDQIYFDINKEDIFMELKKEWDEKLLFNPIWVKDKKSSEEHTH